MIRTRISACHLATTRAPLLALFLLGYLGCAGADRISSPSGVNGRDQTPDFAASKVTGIPFGATGQPISLFGPTSTGGTINPVTPDSLLRYLAAIKAASSRVV